MNDLNDLLIRNGFQLAVRKESINVDKVENLIKFKLPDDYRYYLENFEAFDDFIANHFFRLLDLDSLISYNLDYGIIETMPGMMAIGNNGSSEFIGIEYSGNNACKIVLSPLIDLDKEYNIGIGSSFTDFILRVENNEEWFK